MGINNAMFRLRSESILIGMSAAAKKSITTGENMAPARKMIAIAN
jgi:hypothetical protein